MKTPVKKACSTLLKALAASCCWGYWRLAFSVIPPGASSRLSGKGGSQKKLPKKGSKVIRYLFSGTAYLLLALYAAGRLLGNGDKGGDNTQSTVSELMSKPFGDWLVGILGLILAITGIYQAYYGLSGKYRKHVQGLSLQSTASRNLLRAGTIGYVARGIVWLMLAWLLFRAAFQSDSREAGDTGKAFHFLETASFGSYLLGALGIGLICYGFFNFIRARWERF